MTRLKQAFKNRSSRPQFLFLDLSTSRYRLNPGEELVLHYDGSHDCRNEHGSPLNIEFVDEGTSTTVVIWTTEVEMFHTDGRPAAQDHNPAP